MTRETWKKGLRDRGVVVVKLDTRRALALASIDTLDSDGVEKAVPVAKISTSWLCAC